MMRFSFGLRIICTAYESSGSPPQIGIHFSLSIDIPAPAFRIVVPEVEFVSRWRAASVRIDELGAFARRVAAASHFYVRSTRLNREIERHGNAHRQGERRPFQSALATW